MIVVEANVSVEVFGLKSPDLADLYPSSCKQRDFEIIVNPNSIPKTLLRILLNLILKNRPPMSQCPG